GGSLGGPVILPRFGEGNGPATRNFRDHAFFFLSYEAVRENSTTPVTTYVETPQFRQAVINARPGGVSAAILADGGVVPRIGSLLTSSCDDINGPCQAVAGGLDVGSLTGSLRQYVGGGPPDGIPDIQKVLIAGTTTNRPKQYNARFDVLPNSTNQLTFSTYLTRGFFIGSDTGADA